MLRWFRADLHIHTVLSACADLSMGPRDIVARALAQELDLIAITDHNSSANATAVFHAAQGTGLTVIPGMEISTREEIHMICLFPDLHQAMKFQDYVYSNLQDGTYDASMLGPQVICDHNENILGEDDHMLALPIKISYDRVIKETVAQGGFIYPAHIDRRANGIMRVLGFMPKDLPYNVVEVSKNIPLQEAEERYGQQGSVAVITASDAHEISQIASAVTFFRMAAPTFAELCLAMQFQDDRKVSIVPPKAIIHQLKAV